jgi:kumamolisin
MVGRRLFLALVFAGAGCSSNTPDSSNPGGGGSDAGDKTDGHSGHLDGGRDAQTPPPRDAAPPPPGSATGEQMRALLVAKYRSSDDLDAAIRALYDPSNPLFRKYLTRNDFLAKYAPGDADIDKLRSWAQSQGLEVTRVGTGNLLVELRGVGAQFEKAFVTSVGYSTFGTNHFTFTVTPVVPLAAFGALVAPDDPATAATKVPETGTVDTKLPSNRSSGFLSKDISSSYKADALLSGGVTGAGEAIGIVGTGLVRPSDVQSFWQSQSITRPDYVLVETAEHPGVHNSEATLDIEWSGAMAPAAKVIFYSGPDNHDLSILFAMGEAIARGDVSVVSDSFAHNESSVPIGVRGVYDVLGRMAAATGITLNAASGDSGKVDVPSSSPYFTAVGGTQLSSSGETAWSFTGCGVSSSVTRPWFQDGKTIDPHRAVADVSVNATSYFYYMNGGWSIADGTSFATPVFSGLVALVNASRAQAGKPRTGFLNPLLYTNPDVQRALRDIQSGSSTGNAAGPGWDLPTGWGTPDTAALAQALP